MRMLGAPPRQLAALLSCEALWLALLAAVLGLALGQGLVSLVGAALEFEKSVSLASLTWPPELLLVPALAVVVALASAWLPIWEAYRVNVLELLQSR
jgi:putative ABC transport system permease protein